MVPLLVAGGLQAQATQPASMAEFLLKVKGAALRTSPERSIRLGVAPFRPTEAQKLADRGFGTYLTEQVFASLSSAAPAIRLFERARLDAVLKEQALSSSGMFDETEARKIGELAPIDYLLTGTYTRLEGGISIHGRFIHVGSGEVASTFTERLALTPDLAGLFGPAAGEATGEVRGEARAATRPADPAAACEADWAPIRALMKDLRSPEQVERLVGEAQKVPLAWPCGAIHSEVAYLLRRHELPAPAYRAYLTRQLATLEEPEAHKHAGSILSYLAWGGLSSEAWQAAADLAARSQMPRRYLDLLVEGEDDATLLRRAEAWLAMARAGRIGRPVAQPVHEVALDLFKALKTPSRRQKGEGQAALLFYRKHGSLMDKARDREVIQALEGLATGLEPGPHRLEVLRWIGARLGRIPAVERGQVLNSTCQPLFRERRSAEKEGRSTTRWDQELEALLRAAGPEVVAASFPRFPDRSTRVDLTGFCLSLGWKAEGLPTVSSLLQQLEEPGWAPRTEAIHLLGALGPAAAPAESLLLRQLRRSQDGQEKYVSAEALMLLGRMRTRNPEALQAVVRHLWSLENVLSEGAERALGLLGAPAIPLLKAAWAQRAPYEQIRMVHALQRMGPVALQERAWLNQRLQQAELPQLRDALEDLLEGRPLR